MRNAKLLASAAALLPMLASAQQMVIAFDYLDNRRPLQAVRHSLYVNYREKAVAWTQ